MNYLEIRNAIPAEAMVGRTNARNVRDYLDKTIAEHFALVKSAEYWGVPPESVHPKNPKFLETISMDKMVEYLTEKVNMDVIPKLIGWYLQPERLLEERAKEKEQAKDMIKLLEQHCGYQRKQNAA